MSGTAPSTSANDLRRAGQGSDADDAKASIKSAPSNTPATDKTTAATISHRTTRERIGTNFTRDIRLAGGAVSVKVRVDCWSLEPVSQQQHQRTTSRPVAASASVFTE